MSERMTPAEVLKQHQDSMGNDIGLVFNLLWNDVVWLHSKWKQYCELFRHSPERTAILNSTAPDFFETLDATLGNDLVLHLARLTDQVTTGPDKENLTLMRLPELVKHLPELSAQVENLANAAQQATASARKWRNRHVAHRDFNLALKSHLIDQPRTEPLPVLTADDVEAALEAIRNTLGAIEGHYLASAFTRYQDLVGPGGVDHLVSWLAYGRKVADESDAKGKAGS